MRSASRGRHSDGRTTNVRPYYELWTLRCDIDRAVGQPGTALRRTYDGRTTNVRPYYELWTLRCDVDRAVGQPGTALRRTYVPYYELAHNPPSKAPF